MFHDFGWSVGGHNYLYGIIIMIWTCFWTCLWTYFWTYSLNFFFIHLISAFSWPFLLIELYIVKFFCGYVTSEERDDFIFRSLGTLVCAVYSAYDAPWTYKSTTYSESEAFKACYTFMIHLFVMLIQSAVLGMCNTLILNLNDHPENTEKAKKFESITSSALLLLDCYLGAGSLGVYLETDHFGYLLYTLRYLLMASELAYFKLWLWNSLGEAKVRFLGPNHDHVKGYRHKERIIKWGWCAFKLSVHFYIMVNTEDGFSSFYFIHDLMSCHSIATSDPGSLFGIVIHSTPISGNGEHIWVVAVEQGGIREDHNDCPICFGEMEATFTGEIRLGDDDPVKLSCGHLFHYHCLMEWFEVKENCPTCGRSPQDLLVLEKEGRIEFTEVSGTAFQDEQKVVYFTFAESSDTESSSFDSLP